MSRRGERTHPPVRNRAPFSEPPIGWTRILTRKPSGERYFLYNSADGEHERKSLRKVFLLEAAKRGEDAAKADEDYTAYLRSENAEREQALQRFRESFGNISAYAEHLEGWQSWEDAERKRHANKRRYFLSPDGQEFTRLADLEAWFGKQMQRGVDIAETISRARRACQKALKARRNLSTVRHAMQFSSSKTWHHIQLRQREGATGAAGGRRWVLPKSASLAEMALLQARLRRWRQLTFGHRRRRLLEPFHGEDSADARLARALVARSAYSGPFAEVPVGCGIPPGSAEESWVLRHPLWTKMARRGYPLPISEREILALRSYTPREHGGTADIRYTR
mmetsp:Transcript_32050/g.89268  ORF Transcript_32050/g.89268 Transcript_32050/m.89268 type:complete len:337 (-) Transcript_32050:43-1053(-)